MATSLRHAEFLCGIKELPLDEQAEVFANYLDTGDGGEWDVDGIEFDFTSVAVRMRNYSRDAFATLRFDGVRWRMDGNLVSHFHLARKFGLAGSYLKAIQDVRSSIVSLDRGGSIYSLMTARSRAAMDAEAVRHQVQREINECYECLIRTVRNLRAMSKRDVPSRAPLPVGDVASVVNAAPEAPGVYFVWSSGACVYVGESINLRNRLKGHEKLADADGLSYVHIQDASKRELLLTEAFYIWLYRPVLNFGKRAKNCSKVDAEPEPQGGLDACVDSESR